MIVNEEEVRRYMILEIASVRYLEERVEEEERARGKKITVSGLLEELIESDQAIRYAFTNKSIR